MKRILCLLSLLFLISGLTASAGLEVGSNVDPFIANADSGDLWQLSKHIGKKNIVVYFYPAAMTGGCTKQACAYRDQSSALNDMDAVVVGVSGDSVNNLKLFKQANDLNFPLLSDADGSIAELFGVDTKGGGSIERQLEGITHVLTRGLTTMRWTFIIGKDGKVVYKNDKVKATEDTSTVISELKKLG
ncbi:MAG: redoxin domain-containing protein [Opitutales bacterium]|jgi:thioredoxin-dependent peroxiredoxin|nr:redoxin domain-containing protein [Opitutales bacterium]MDG2169674.1 redoxin domain-containing protein [Opitutales bacterium]